MADSARSFFVDIIFDLGDGTEVEIDTTRYFQSLTLEESTEESAQGNLTLFDEERDVIESILVLGTRRMKMRWDWESNRGIHGEVYRHAEITKYKPTFAPEGVTVSIDFIGTGYQKQALKKLKKPISWPAGIKPSEIVRQIAEKHGWKVVDSEGRPTIEESENRLTQPIQMQNESDIDFIREQLIKRTTNSDKEDFYVKLDSDSEPPVIHFHSEKFLDRGNGVKKALVFASDPNSEVISFEPSDDSLFQSILGSENSKHDSNDSREGEPAQENSDNPKGAGQQTKNPHEEEKPDHAQEGGVNARRSIVSRDVEDLRRQAWAKISRLREHAFKATVQKLGDNEVVPFDLLSIRYDVEPGRPHFLSGIYRVHGVTHELSSDSWTTSYDLMRRGTLPTGQQDEQVAGRKIERTTRENPSNGLQFISKEVE